MKKLLAGLVVALFAITLTACGSSSKPTTVQGVIDLLNADTGNFKAVATSEMDYGLGMTVSTVMTMELDGNKGKMTMTMSFDGESQTEEMYVVVNVEDNTTTNYNYDTDTETWYTETVNNPETDEVEFDLTAEDFVETEKAGVYELTEEALAENGSQMIIDLSDSDTITITMAEGGVELIMVLSDFDKVTVTLPTIANTEEDNESAE